MAILLALGCPQSWQPVEAKVIAGPGVATQGVHQRSRLIALRVVGSNVKNPQGENLGRIEEVAINPNSGQIEFAMLQLHYPKSTGRVTPVPWKVLTYLTDQSQTGGLPGAVQTFNLNMSRAQLERAPSVEHNAWANLNEPYWVQRIFAYYGVTTDAPMLAGTPTPTPATQVPPEGMVQGYEPSPYASTSGSAGTTVFPGDFGAITNAPPFVPIPPGATNPIFNTNIFLNRTNFFLNRTNFFPGTRTPFNPDKPSTFPPDTTQPNSGPMVNPLGANDSPPPMLVLSNSSPFSPRFPGGSSSDGLPIPVVRNSPWSPPFGLPNAPQLPIQEQPTPWGPRFILPQDPGTTPPVNDSPNPWGPRFLSPAGSTTASLPQQLVGPSGPSPFTPPFRAVQPAIAPQPPPRPAAPHPAPVIKAAPARRR